MLRAAVIGGAEVRRVARRRPRPARHRTRSGCPPGSAAQDAQASRRLAPDAGLIPRAHSAMYSLVSSPANGVGTQRRSAR